MRVLCVCLGNICRSPTAEGVLRAMAPEDWTVDSAGTGGWHIGNPPYPPAVSAAKARGYDISGLRARKFGVSDFTDFDLILAMDKQNRQDIEACRPQGCKTPVKLFMGYAETADCEEVPDPYYTGNFEGVLELIEAAATGLVTEYGG